MEVAYANVINSFANEGKIAKMQSKLRGNTVKKYFQRLDF
jgi:hypothetical protein